MFREILHCFQAASKICFLLEIDRHQVWVPRMSCKHRLFFFFLVQFGFTHWGKMALHMRRATDHSWTCGPGTVWKLWKSNNPRKKKWFALLSTHKKLIPMTSGTWCCSGAKKNTFGAQCSFRESIADARVLRFLKGTLELLHEIE